MPSFSPDIVMRIQAACDQSLPRYFDDEARVWIRRFAERSDIPLHDRNQFARAVLALTENANLTFRGRVQHIRNIEKLLHLHVYGSSFPRD